MPDKKLLKKCAAIICALAIAGLAFLFFTNDFGLVDLRKTSVVIGVGLDKAGDELELTAQLAVPQPAENGEKTQFSVITGRGATVAEALNEINVRTGFYPKLVFCELILLGESCLSGDVFGTLQRPERVALGAECCGQQQKEQQKRYSSHRQFTLLSSSTIDSRSPTQVTACVIWL